MNKPKSRFVAGLLAVSLACAALPPQAQAGIIATDAVAAAAARERVASALEREAVRAQLESHGVSALEVQARVDALSDAEVTEVARQLDSLPAGGNALVGAVVLVFLVLLLTDIVGLTKVFPFTRSIKK
jgi:hypothetical protein